jgi:glyoxylase-like metal-dependent hydrolase (beta-lactamase superfamily II)
MRDFMPGPVIAGRVSEIVPAIFRIVVPLPIPDVGSMNAYVIVDADRNLIIDPGMAHPTGCEVIENAIAELGVDLERTDFFTTHHHLDHFGGVSRFLSRASRIFISKPEADFIERIASGGVEEELGVFLEMLGFPEKNPMHLFAQFYGEEFRPRHRWPFHYVANGDVIERGGYRFTCLISSGHTIGHTCLYEANRRFLISGDQITAGVQFLLDRANPMEDHFQGLARFREMEVALVLPGHGSPFRDHKKRIDILQSHHQGRSDSVYAVLSDDKKDAYELTVALDSMLSDREPMDKLPLVLRFIHTRHTFAYLQQLTVQGRAIKENHSGRVLFSRRRRSEPDPIAG